ncbi:MAG: bifunctional DNA-formamidopyrimidine glycosylase/DNA-(apurinic or apyrimidinic site) lyase [Actinomycetes bacterium]
MPELPEVEVVRSGLARFVTARTIAGVDVLHPRAIRRHEPGSHDFAARLAGRQITSVSRRGKYLWFVLDGRDLAVVGHLGMSGQLLVQPSDAPDEKHLRIRVRFADGGRELRFIDQRTFGGMALDELVSDGAHGLIPSTVAHISRDPLDPTYQSADFVRALKSRRTGLKRALLDQTVVSGIGNIYADEALWRARLHYAYPAEALQPSRARELLVEVQDVMTQALAQGGTSFDALYVNVNGESGYFDVSLNAYGQENEPCPRCGRLIVREPFMNRSSYRCPNCQRTPRNARW